MATNGEQSDTGIADVGEAEVTAFCAAVGELILWASLIDTQLNKAILGLFALPDHRLIEPIVAQLDARPKTELLKKRAKLIPPGEWRRRVGKWVEHAEQANAKRNVVAHHGMRIEGGRILLHSDQLTRLIDRLAADGGALIPADKKGSADVVQWIEQAKAAYGEGETVLANLDRFRGEARLRSAARGDAGTAE